MSYTSPSNTATDFSFAGKVSYTQSNPQVTNFNFGFLSGTATGFISGTFGTGKVKPNAIASTTSPTTTFGTANITPRAATFGPTAMFGLPVKQGQSGVYIPWTVTTTFGAPTSKIAPVPTSINSTMFGTPRLFPFYAREFWVDQTFGTPTAFNGQRTTGVAPSTTFGLALAKVHQTGVATGFSPTKYGTPWFYFTTTVPLNVTGWASGARATRLGTPNVMRAHVGDATGFASTHLGIHELLRGGTASGFWSTVLGTPSTTMKSRATGFRLTTFGLATTKITGVQTGRVTTRFGTGSSSRSDTYLAWSINGSRFGTPRSSRVPLRDATGFSTTSFGTAESFTAHRAKFFRSTQIGQPIMRRAC